MSSSTFAIAAPSVTLLTVPASWLRALSFTLLLRDSEVEAYERSLRDRLHRGRRSSEARKRHSRSRSRRVGGPVDRRWPARTDTGDRLGAVAQSARSS